MAAVQPVSFFRLQKQCRSSTSAQQSTQRLVQFGCERRLQNVPKPLPLPSKERKRVYEECQRSLEAGFNVLLLGLGSKYDLVQEMSRAILCEYPCVTISGYSNQFSMRYLLVTIAERILGYQLRGSQVAVMVEDLIRVFKERANTHIYLVIHNIDGPCFRTVKIQNVFSQLAESKFIRVIATADHIRTRLLWDSAAASSLAFHTIQVHTLQPYLMESANPALNRKKSRAKGQDLVQTQSTSIDAILPSLTSRHKEALSYLAYSQVNRNPAGLTFLEWMETALSTSDRDFRVLVNELTYHKIVVEVEDPDTAAIHFKIPFSNEVIESKLLLDDDLAL